MESGEGIVVLVFILVSLIILFMVVIGFDDENLCGIFRCTFYIGVQAVVEQGRKRG